MTETSESQSRAAVPTTWQHAQVIMVELGETEPTVRSKIRRAIEVLGIDVVQSVVVEAHATEAQGGLLRQDGQRRTLGGVFFAVLKTHCTKEQFQRIFWPKPPRKATPPAPPPPSEQALQIATVIIQKLKLSAKKQTAIARDVERIGVAEALAALRSTLKVEQQGGRMAADGNRIKPLKVWRTALESTGGSGGS